MLARLRSAEGKESGRSNVECKEVSLINQQILSRHKNLRCRSFL